MRQKNATWSGRKRTSRDDREDAPSLCRSVFRQSSANSRCEFFPFYIFNCAKCIRQAFFFSSTSSNEWIIIVPDSESIKEGTKISLCNVPDRSRRTLVARINQTSWWRPTHTIDWVYPPCAICFLLNGCTLIFIGNIWPCDVTFTCRYMSRSSGKKRKKTN